MASASVVIANAAGIESTANAMSAVDHPGERQDHRRGHAPAVLAREEARAVVVLAHGQHPAHERAVRPCAGVDVLVRAAQDPPGEHQQRRAQHVDDPVEALDQLDAHEDRQRRACTSASTMPQNSSLPRCSCGHGEGAEDQQEDEEVVERQRALDQVDGQVVDGAVAAVERPQRQRHGDARARTSRCSMTALSRKLGSRPRAKKQQVDEQERHRRPRSRRRAMRHALRLRRTRSRGRRRPAAAATPRTTSTRPRW